MTAKSINLVVLVLYSIFTLIIGDNLGRLLISVDKESFTPNINNNPVFVESAVADFIESINYYTENGWSFEKQMEIQSGIFVGPTADIDYDLPDARHLNNENKAIESYLNELRDNKVKVRYSNDFEILNCSGKVPFSAAFVSKEVFINGEVLEFQELIYLESYGTDELKVNAITSSKYGKIREQEEKYNCKNPRKPIVPVRKKRCILFEDAEIAYAQGQYPQALILYRQSEFCAPDLAFLDSRIRELEMRSETLEKRRELIVSAENAYLQDRYEEALSFYQTYLNSYAKEESFPNLEEVTSRINKIRAEIDFKIYVEQADFYMTRSNYQKAITTYEKALALKPGNYEVNQKISLAKNKLRGAETARIKREIEQATKNLGIRSRQKDGLITLLKYRDSGLLNGEHFLKMTYVLDANFGSAKKAFGFTNRDCCMLVRRFALQASRMGIPQKQFDYLWNEHFNNRSKSCK